MAASTEDRSGSVGTLEPDNDRSKTEGNQTLGLFARVVKE